MIDQNIIKEYFKSKNIPYDEIDENIRELVYVFNKIGLTTSHCCEGHKDYKEPSIIIHQSVKSDKIYELCKKLFTKNTEYGSFKLWVRSGTIYSRNKKTYFLNDTDEPEIWKNWIFYIPISVPITFERRIKAINKATERIQELYNICDTI